MCSHRSTRWLDIKNRKTIWNKGLFSRDFSNDIEDASCVHQLAITFPPEFVAETNVADKTNDASIYKKRRRKTGTFRANAYSYNDATGGSKWHELICINPAITVDSGSLERLVPQFIRRPNPLPKILEKQLRYLQCLNARKNFIFIKFFINILIVNCNRLHVSFMLCNINWFSLIATNKPLCEPIRHEKGKKWIFAKIWYFKNGHLKARTKTLIKNFFYHFI